MALNAALPLCARAAATRRNALKIPKLIEGTTGNPSCAGSAGD